MHHYNKTSLAVENSRLNVQELRFLLQFATGYRGRVVAALVLLLFAKISTVSVPILLKTLIDTLNGQSTQTQWLLVPMGLVGAYGALRVVSFVFNELKNFIFARVRFDAMRQLSLAVLKKMNTLSLRWHLQRRTGGIAADLDRANNSLSTVLNFLLFNILPTFAELALVLGILLVSFKPIYTAVALIAIACYIGFTFSLSAWRINHRHEMNALESEASSRAVDSLINFETVKYFNNEDFEIASYDDKLQQWSDAAVKTQLSMSLLNAGQALIVTLAVSFMLAYATSEVIDGTLTLGELVMINALMLQLFVPLNFLGTTYRLLKYALADMQRIFNLLMLDPEVKDIDKAPALVCNAGKIRFEQVSFSYNQDREILRGLDFEVAPGQKVAIVGPSGAGKSTIAKLLYRFYDLNQGRISIDDQDIAKVSQSSLHAHISVVPQDTVLFNDTLRYNLTYAKHDASEADIHHALEVADLSRFVARTEQGLDTLVGERGLKLSGGEKQRVAIARAVLKNAPIAVFDEATSSLDTASERLISEALGRVSAQATSLVIAHRLSTVVDADQILVLNDGVIVERGTHNQLIEADGLYAELWALQSET